MKPAATPKWGVPWALRAGEGTIIEDASGIIVAMTWWGTTATQKKRAVALAKFIVATVNGSKDA